MTDSFWLLHTAFKKITLDSQRNREQISIFVKVWNYSVNQRSADWSTCSLCWWTNIWPWISKQAHFIRVTSQRVQHPESHPASCLSHCRALSWCLRGQQESHASEHVQACVHSRWNLQLNGNFLLIAVYSCVNFCQEVHSCAWKLQEKWGRGPWVGFWLTVTMNAFLALNLLTKQTFFMFCSY